MAAPRATRNGSAKGPNPTVKTPQEKILEISSPVFNQATAEAWLSANKYINSPHDVTTQKLSMLLLEESLKPPSSPSLKPLMRAVAYLLDSTISSHFTSSLVEKLDSSINTATSTLMGKIKTNVDLLDALATKCSELTSNSQAHIDKIANTASKIAELTAPSTPTPLRGTSYRDAVALSQAPNVKTATDAKIANRLTIQARQLMLKYNSESSDAPNNLSDEAANMLRKKAVAALEQMPEAKINNVGIRLVTILRNGNVLIELTTVTGAEWLRKEPNITDFLNRFTPDASIVRRNYPIVLRFVPFSFTPDLDSSLRDLETQWNLEPGSLLAANWIKNPAKRGSRQTVANVKLNCLDANTANKILISPLRINGRQIAAKKDIKEPSVCNKCQSYGHYARDCEAPHDICAVCGGEHKTETCPDPSVIKCTPCGANDHKTGNRTCPEYLKRLKAQDAKAPELSKPFYPTDERWTWDNSEEAPYIPDRLPQLSLNILRNGSGHPTQTRHGNKSGKRGFTQTTLTTSSNFIPLNANNHRRLPGRSKFPSNISHAPTPAPSTRTASTTSSSYTTPRTSQSVLPPTFSPYSPPDLSSIDRDDTTRSPQSTAAPVAAPEITLEPTTYDE